MDRRQFLTAFVIASVAGSAEGFAWALSKGRTTQRSLVPAKPSGAPNYWCTWAMQNYRFGQGTQSFEAAVLEGDSGARLARDAMGEEVLFGNNGWASHLYSRVREDLYLLLDDGWEAGGTATFELDSAKFPSFKGTPTERLRGLNQRIEQLGWRGAALWCRNTPGGKVDAELENQCESAGVRYWKIDLGDRDFNLVRARDQARIPLTLEHVHGEMPVNGDWAVDGRFGSQSWDSGRMQILRHTDVYRTYDVTSILSLPTTLDRVSEMLQTAAGHPELRSLLNVEDEVYVAAVLGCTMGVMRHSSHGLRPGGDPDLFFNGARRAKQRMDEVVRAVRWQRIAEPYPTGVGSFRASAEILRDGWKFDAGQTWQHELLKTTVWQAAPAILARNIDLPLVSEDAEKPFVFAARFPNGAVAIGAQERTQPDRPWYTPLCDVTLKVGDAPGPFGIFGEFRSLTLELSKPIGSKHILAQDLVGDNAADITSLARVVGDTVNFDGRLLRRLGLRDGTPGDLSSPALALVFD